MLTRADDLVTLPVQDAEGAEHTVGSLCRERPTVLVFIRHFG